MREVKLENISNNDNVILCAIMDKIEISDKLKKVNGYPFNYILALKKEIIYIGYSSSIHMRLQHHKYTKHFDKIILIEMKDKKSALLMEKNLIKTYEPKYNYKYLV